MQSVTTDNVDGVKIVSNEDGLVAVQFRNSTNTNLFLVTEKTQSFKDRGVVVKPNEVWPINGPGLWAGDLWVYTDGNVRQTFGLLKSLTLSLVPHKKGGSF